MESKIKVFHLVKRFIGIIDLQIFFFVDFADFFYSIMVDTYIFKEHLLQSQKLLGSCLNTHHKLQYSATNSRENAVALTAARTGT